MSCKTYCIKFSILSAGRELAGDRRMDSFFFKRELHSAGDVKFNVLLDFNKKEAS